LPIAEIEYAVKEPILILASLFRFFEYGFKVDQFSL